MERAAAVAFAVAPRHNVPCAPPAPEPRDEPLVRYACRMRLVILSEAKDPRSPEREPSAGMTKIRRLTPRDDTPRYPSLNTVAGSIRVARNPGTAAAKIATTANTVATSAYVHGSFAVTP
jgi:hypothetical protein